MKIPLSDEIAARVEARLAKFSLSWTKLDLDPLRRATSFKVVVLCEMLGGRTKAADAVELTDNTLDNYRHGKQDPTFATLEMLAEKVGIAGRYLGGEWSFEKGSIRIDLSGDGAAGTTATSMRPPGLMDNPPAPYLHGYDEIGPSAALIEHYWRRLGLDPASMSAVLAEGDSMMPTIADQSPVFVDTADRNLADGGIYALRAEGRLIIRRVQRLIGGGVQLLADNAAAYPPQEIGEATLADLEILGRVRSAAVAC
ncbi:S24 family peptidase [Neorhizobium sp. NCHU2750]|uniref:S24 family peptidase n=1 Tax=Neorhizobium sp. NCHU2750 TaxID=1825976 RepID=UPI000E715B99|nr:putative phage repressor [Neorhizobium sp. NCHU2750]